MSKLIDSLRNTKSDIILDHYSSRILEFSASELEAITVNLISAELKAPTFGTILFRKTFSGCRYFALEIVKNTNFQKPKLSRKLIMGLDYGETKKSHY